jgi:hypothetical protein
LDFVDFDFDGTRTHAARQYHDRQPIAHGFAFSKRAVVVFGDTDSFTDSTQPNRCTLQESKSALDWTGRDGWTRLGHRD